MRLQAPAVVLVLAALWPAAVTAQQAPDALAAYRSGDFQTAADITRNELDANPSNLDSYVVMGWSLIALGRYTDAVEAADAGLAVARYDQRIIEISAESLYFLGRREEALARFEEYAALSPEGARIERVYAYMGEIFIELEEYQNADIAFTRALYALPNTTAWWARLGYARELAGTYGLALEAYDRALSLDPDLGDAERGRDRVQRLAAETSAGQ